MQTASSGSGVFSPEGPLVPRAKYFYDHFEMEEPFCIRLQIPGPVCCLFLSPKEKRFSQVSQLRRVRGFSVRAQ